MPMALLLNKALLMVKYWYMWKFVETSTIHSELIAYMTQITSNYVTPPIYPSNMNVYGKVRKPEPITVFRRLNDVVKIVPFPSPYIWFPVCVVKSYYVTDGSDFSSFSNRFSFSDCIRVISINPEWVTLTWIYVLIGNYKR